MTAKKEPVGTNPLQLPFPQDPSGVFLDLRRGALKSIGRINGDAEKLSNFKNILGILLRHAEERFEVDTKQREVAKKNAVAARIRHDERLREHTEVRVKELENMVAKLRREAGIE